MFGAKICPGNWKPVPKIGSVKYLDSCLFLLVLVTNEKGNIHFGASNSFDLGPVQRRCVHCVSIYCYTNYVTRPKYNFWTNS